MVDDSKFHKWRAIVAMAHADGHVSAEEEQFVGGYLQRLPFSADQRAQLSRELREGVDIDGILDKIDNPRDRAMLVHFARLLCHADGEEHPDETALLERMRTSVMAKADILAAQAALRSPFDAPSPAGERKERFVGLFERFFNAFSVDLTG